MVLDLYVDDSAWIYMATNLRLPEYSVVGAKLATKLGRQLRLVRFAAKEARRTEAKGGDY